MTKRSGYYEELDMYQSGDLTDQEQGAIREELKDNQILQEELKFYRDVDQSIGELDVLSLRKNLNTIMQEEAKVLKQSSMEGQESKKYSFGLSEEISSFREFYKPAGTDGLEQAGHSLPRMHLYQHQLASRENIHQFYREQFEELESEDELLLSESEELLFQEVEKSLDEKDIAELRNNLQQISISLPGHQHSTEDIEEYLDQSMELLQFQEFDQELSINQWLAQDVALHREVEMAYGEQDIIDLRAHLQEIQESEFSSSQRTEDMDRYLTGDMDSSELGLFESELASNTELAGELEMYREIDIALEETEVIQLRGMLQDIAKETVSTGKQRSVRWMPSRLAVSAAAASVVILLGVGALVSRQGMTDTDLYNRFYQSQAVPDVSRSAGSGLDRMLTDALSRYGNHEYERAIALFREINQVDASNAVSHFYAGASYQESGRYQEALQEYGAVLKDKDNLFVEQAQWNIALVLLKSGERQQAKEQFNRIAEGMGYYSEKAQAVLRKMKKQRQE